MLPLAGASLTTDAPTGAAGRRIGSRVPDQLRERAARLRRLDDVLGGGDTYRAYLAEYRATAALLKHGRYTEQTKRGLLSVLAEQAQQAGWAAFDAGWHANATNLYEESLRLGRVSKSASLLHGQRPCPAARTGAAAPEIISPVLTSSGTVAGLFSLLGPVRFACGLPGSSQAESRFR
ncbi:MAG: hypothetical protein ACRDT4_14370 [Micromonosporaceae bacterium]